MAIPRRKHFTAVYCGCTRQHSSFHWHSGCSRPEAAAHNASCNATRALRCRLPPPVDMFALRSGIVLPWVRTQSKRRHLDAEYTSFFRRGAIEAVAATQTSLHGGLNKNKGESGAWGGGERVHVDSNDADRGCRRDCKGAKGHVDGTCGGREERVHECNMAATCSLMASGCYWRKTIVLFDCVYASESELPVARLQSRKNSSWCCEISCEMDDACVLWMRDDGDDERCCCCC